MADQTYDGWALFKVREDRIWMHDWGYSPLSKAISRTLSQCILLSELDEQTALRRCIEKKTVQTAEFNSNQVHIEGVAELGIAKVMCVPVMGEGFFQVLAFYRKEADEDSSD